MDIYKLINASLEEYGVAILPPMDIKESLPLLAELGIRAQTSILDPWYNKGFGGVLPDEEYDNFVSYILNGSALLSEVIYLWGFPEVIGPYVRFAPQNFKTSAWLTWYYKNCPSVIRGWRSSQNACIQFSREGTALHPENFLNDEQLERFNTGKMRFIPGPSSVIESSLIVGFVGKKERVGHPSQKPESVYEKLILMSTKQADLVIDLMAGSGTTGAVAHKYGRKAILCDVNEEYIQMMEKRLGCSRITQPPIGKPKVAKQQKSGQLSLFTEQGSE